MKKRVKLKTLATTKKLANDIAKGLRGGEVLALSGPLGSGKTTFTQFLSLALGVPRGVKSPTFIVMQIHKMKRTGKREVAKLCHIDAYRIDDITELDAIGLHDYMGRPDVITVIEWAEKIKKAIPKTALWLTFSFDKGKREVTVRP